VTYLRGAGYQGFHAGWHATLRTTTVGYGGAAVGLRHAVYRWGATQALYIPPIQTRILPYPQKVKLSRQLCVAYHDVRGRRPSEGEPLLENLHYCDTVR
jgi:hypothetical protein